MFSKRTNWPREENAYTRALQRHRASGKPIIDLTVSNPTACGFQYDEAGILAALAAPASLGYDPEPKGLRQARAAVAKYYLQKNSDARLDLERLILTTGTSEAYSFLFPLLCEPGDEIVIAQPSYPLFEFLAAIHDVKLSPFLLVYDHGWQVDFAALTKTISSRTRAIILVHPNNPTGHFVSESEAGQLQKLCLEREIALVVDEVFLDYKIPVGDSRPKHGSFIFDARALTFVVSGLSKIAGLPQMKIGWIAAAGPDALVHEAIARLEIIADTYLSLNAPVQHALTTLLAQRGVMQPQIMRRIEENLQKVDEELKPQSLVSRLEFEGGWFAVLRVPAVQSDEELAIRLLEDYSVLAHPGHFYDFPDDGYLVVCLLTPAEEFAEGICRIIQCVGISNRKGSSVAGK
jgi:aspartate/methionine/tyrosine aminotransferase